MPTRITAHQLETASARPVRMTLIKEISEQIRRPFLMGMAILLLAGLASYFALESYRSSSQQVVRSDRVISLLNDLLLNIDRAEASERGYLTSGVSPDEGAALAAAIHQDLSQIKQAARDSAIAPREADALSAQVEAKLKFFDQLSAVRAAQGEAAATAMFTAGQADDLLSGIHDRAQQMTSAQEGLLAVHLADQHTLSRLLGFLVVAGCILAFAAVTYAGYFVENAFKLIASHLTEDANGREALAALNETLEERINERSAAAAQCAHDLERAHRDLRHQGQILQAVLNFIDEGVLVCDTHMRLLQTNPAAERLLGEGFGNTSLDHLLKTFEMADPLAAKPFEASDWPLEQALRGQQC
ncbi:MAG TPA: CHASE3 domain-containing protein, partial [Candidatus Binataceae bacterium]|nr:CHASE3 domain-containing protein [Candidatus Binataceae bacterium]